MTNIIFRKSKKNRTAPEVSPIDALKAFGIIVDPVPLSSPSSEGMSQFADGSSIDYCK